MACGPWSPVQVLTTMPAPAPAPSGGGGGGGGATLLTPGGPVPITNPYYPPGTYVELPGGVYQNTTTGQIILP